MPSGDGGALYGITAENSSRHGAALWGKNQFNSTFPLALCLYMRDREIDPVSIACNGEGEFAAGESWRMSDVIGKAEQSPYYRFEAEFAPYDENGFSRNALDKIDLIAFRDDSPYLPLEVKLTVVPDITTANKDEEEWSPEIVIRPVSSAYAMMSAAKGILNRGNLKEEIIGALRKAYNAVDDWNNQATILGNFNGLRDGLERALQLAAPIQNPFLIQPIWKTKGQSLTLCERCLDVFVWSDVALMMVPVDQTERDASSIARPMREVARHAKALYELLTQGDYDYNGVYKGMPLGLQTDKGFSLPGTATRKYMRHERLQSPILASSVLSEIILSEGHQNLRPERRFDAAVKFHMEQADHS